MADSLIRCDRCGAESPEGFRFCGNCGANLVSAPKQPEVGGRTVFFGAMQQPNQAKLILIKGEGLDGVSYVLNADEHVVGRQEGEICFSDDPFLSPRHATFYYQDAQLWVRDERSINGVFVRLREPVKLRPSSRFLLGEQLIELDEVSRDDARVEADEDGTFLYGSPRRTGFIKLIQILRGGAVGMIFRSPAEQVTMGREGNDINFPDDPFISGQHAMVRVDGDTYTLTDLRSKNGTFLRIDEPQLLRHGDYVFVGQQLFRVEIT